MRRDHPELPEEISQTLGRLGAVAPPDPGVLDAAREVLWAAVAAEMLPEAAGEAGQFGETHQRRVAQRETDECQPDQRQTDECQPDQRETDQRQPDQRQTDQRQTDQRQTDQRQTDQRETDQRQADQPGQAGRPRPADPGA
jgi:hypothetical protein